MTREEFEQYAKENGLVVWSKEQSERAIKALEQEPKTGSCKDCKWWKDSDGTYKRGCGAESICRINTDKVYQGEGYCYLFEPQESEK